MSLSAPTPAASPPGAKPPVTVGALMDPPLTAISVQTTVGEATDVVRTLSKRTLVTYLYAVDADQRLLGVVTMRDLLLNPPERKLEDIMLRAPFTLRPEAPVLEAMRQMLDKHFPCYPVCDSDGKFLGHVWGHRLAAAEAFELSAQAGTMVGVDKDEQISTHWLKSLRFRHPWLQLNLLTAFIAAAVVGFFESTISQIVVLAAFLPVTSSPTGNAGYQTLAVALRGMTLGALKSGMERALFLKEITVGTMNGILTGITAGLGMFVYALVKKTPESPLLLGLTVFFAMFVACVVGGVAGVLTPMILRRLGADPATASGIFLVTATDVASMGCFLGLATWWLT